MNATDIQKFLHEREKNRLQVYENILQKCNIKIQNAVLRDEEFTVITIPDFIIGFPTYNFQNCIKYVIFKLKQNNFKVKYYYPNALQIFWGKKDFNSLLNIEDIPQTKRLTIQSSNKKINNPRDLNEISYKNNISLNFAKKSTKKKKDTFKDISEFVPRTNIFSKFK